MSNLVLTLFVVFNTLSLGNNTFKVQEINFHPVHVSYTNVEYNVEKKQFDILFKIFVDDFDKILQKKYNVFLNLEKGKRLKDYDKIISKYIIEHFKIVINNKDYTSARLKFTHSELKEKAIWLRYTSKYKGKSKRFEVRNSLMTDLYRDQTNLLIFSYLTYQEAVRFTNNKTKEILLVK